MIEACVGTGSKMLTNKHQPTLKNINRKCVHLQGMPNVRYLDNKQGPLQGIIKLKFAFKTPVK